MLNRGNLGLGVGVGVGLALALGCAAGNPPGFDSSAFAETESDDDDDDGETPSTISASATATSTSTSTGNGSTTSTSTGGKTTIGDSTDEPDTTPVSSTSGSTTGVPGTEDSTTGPGIECGNDVIEEGEDCDGTDLAMMTCTDVNPMWTGGTLACDGRCAFDEAGCAVAGPPVTMCSSPGTAIPDNGAAITDTVTIAEMGAVTDVDVHVELAHTWVGDLTVDVTHGATTVRVFDELCVNQDDMDADFDDEAGAAFDCPNSAAGNAHQPGQPLTAFDTAEGAGAWQISVQDGAALDTGSLTMWCVTLSFT